MADIKKNMPGNVTGVYAGQVDQPKSLKKKQAKSIEDYSNQPDPVGDFVRRIIGGNKAKKQGQ